MIGLTGGTIGKSRRYRYDHPSLLNQRVCVLRNETSVLNGLLYFYVKSEIFIRYVFYNSFRGIEKENRIMWELLNEITYPYKNGLDE